MGKPLEELMAELERKARERMTSTEPDSNRTVYEGSGATVPENSDATVYEDGNVTVPEPDAAICEASGITVPENETISEKPMNEQAPGVYEKGQTILDTYVVESSPIHGGMGSVWRVRLMEGKGHAEVMAMKRPLANLFQNEAQKESFVRECEAWIDLGLHRNIVYCHYVRELDGVPTIFSEWMNMGSLENQIRSGGLYDGTEELVRERLLDIAIQFARGLHYAHGQGIIHQDVKPDNLLLSDAEWRSHGQPHWDAKVADFGLARARTAFSVSEGENADPSATVITPSGGYTPAYCSMEQMDGRPLTRRTDIYSWAVSVLEMYLGDRPWMSGVVAGVCCENYFEKCRIYIPERLRSLLRRCMAAEPDDRPHDFAEVERELREIFREELGRAYFRGDGLPEADTAGSLNNRALSYLDLGQPERAAELWEKAVREDIRDVNCIFNLALYRWRGGELTYSEAVASLKAIQNEAKRRECAAELERESKGKLSLNLSDVGKRLDLSVCGFSADGTLVCGTRGAKRTPQEEDTYIVCRVADGTMLFSRQCRSLRLRSDGLCAAVEVKTEHNIKTLVYELPTGAVSAEFCGRGKLSPDFRYIIAEPPVFSAPKTVFDVQTGRELVRLEKAEFCEFTEQNRLLVRFSDRRVCLIDPESPVFSEKNEVKPLSSSDHLYRVGERGRYFVSQRMHERREDYRQPASFDSIFDGRSGELCCTVPCRNEFITYVGELGENRLLVIRHLNDFSIEQNRIVVHYRASVWDRRTGRVIDECIDLLELYGAEFRSSHREYFLWLETQMPPAGYRAGKPAQLRISRVTSEFSLLDDNRERYEAAMRSARLRFGRGDRDGAYQDVCSALSVTGYGTDMAAIELRERVCAYLPHIGLGGILPLNAPVPAQEPTEPGGTIELSHLSAELEKWKKSLYEKYQSGVHSRYTAEFSPGVYSKNGRVFTVECRYTRYSYEYDDPNNDDEETTWHALQVYDVQSLRLLYTDNSLYSWWGNGTKLYRLSDQGKSLFILSGNRLRIVDLTEGKVILNTFTDYKDGYFLGDGEHILCINTNLLVSVVSIRDGSIAGKYQLAGSCGRIRPIGESFFAVEKDGAEQLFYLSWNYDIKSPQ